MLALVGVEPDLVMAVASRCGPEPREQARAEAEPPRGGMELHPLDLAHAGCEVAERTASDRPASVDDEERPCRGQRSPVPRTERPAEAAGDLGQAGCLRRPDIRVVVGAPLNAEHGTDEQPAGLTQMVGAEGLRGARPRRAGGPART